MREPQNIADLLSLDIDYLGFIFYEKSPRHINSSDISHLPNFGEVKKVGVFVNHSIEFVLEKIHHFGLDLVQLHGEESVIFCRELQKIIHANKRSEQIKIIKVFSVGSAFDFDQLAPYKSVVDYFLFDTKGKNLGGNGVTFDWELLKNYDNAIPFFLSGGIDMEHIPQIKALRHLNIHALDINSKFELSAGLKDVAKIERFVANLG
ncbi:MAG: phosphoribosylanthranilate isomerase [Cytophagales bacterium]|nr:MAG: phosphoribosylanthranilate isomerase [Cytophagales bacterium]